MKAKPLKLLFLEDDPADAELAVAALESAGYTCEWERVETREAFLKCLDDKTYDLVVSDFSLPAFDGLSAAKLFSERNVDIPFILVSGTLGEEAAIDSIKAGANDFVLKDKMFRLPTVVERALKEVADKRNIQEAEKKIRLQAAALESAANAIVITAIDGSVTYVNKAFETLTGYSADEVIGQDLRILKSDQHGPDVFRSLWDTILAGCVWHGELVNRHKSGSFYIEEQTITPVKDSLGNIVNFVAVKQDVSERNRIETENALLAAQIDAERARLDTIVGTVPGIVWEAWGQDNSPRPRDDFVSHYVEPMLGYTVDEWLATPNFWLTIVHPDDKERCVREARAAIETGVTAPVEFRWIARDGRLIWAETHSVIIYDDMGKAVGVRGVTIDITERKQAEAAFKRSEEQNRELVENAIDIIYTHNLDGYYTSVNRAVEDILGYTRAEALSLRLSDTVTPEYLEKAERMMSDLSGGQKSVSDELEVFAKDGRRVTLEVNSKLLLEDGKAVGVQGIARDITERKRVDAQRKAIFEITQGAIAAEGIDEFFAIVHRAISSIVYAENCFVMLHDAASDMVRFEFWVDTEDPKPDAKPKSLATGYAGYVLRTGEPMRLTGSEKKGLRDLGKAEQIGRSSASWIGVPLHTSSRTIGVLVLQHYEKPNVYSERDLEFLARVGDQIALAIERKHSEQELHFKNLILTTQQEATIDGILVVGNDGKIVSHNLRFLEMWEIPPDLVEKKDDAPLLAFVAGKVADPESFQSRVKYLYEHDLEISRDEIALKNGRTFDRYSAPMKGLDDRSYGRVWYFRDVTESKQIQEAIRDSEARYRLLFDANPHPMWAYDLVTLAFLAVNDAAVEHYGYSRDEFLAMTIKDIRPAEDVAALMKNYGKTVPGVSNAGIWRHKKKDGSLIVVEITSHELIFGGRQAEVVLANDVTERQKAESALKMAEEQYRGIFENAIEGIFRSSPEGRFISVNPSMAQILGFDSPEQLIAERTDIGAQHYVDQRFRRELESLLANNGVAMGFELEVYRRDGSRIWTQENIRAIHDVDGELLYYEGSIEDITERKRVGEALSESEERYRDLVENAIDIIYTHDLNGNYKSVNKAAQRITGYTRDEALSMNLIDSIAPEYIETAKEMIKAKLAGDDVTAYHLEIIAKDGHRVTLDVNTRIIYENGVPVGVQGIARDMTERIEMEDQLRQSQKMEAVGVLAGGIAHDFNNLLTAISGYSDLTLMAMAPDDKLRRYVDEIKGAGVRAAALTGQLLAFGRKQVLKPSVHNLNTVINEIEGMLRRIIRENIEFRTLLAADLGNIKADSGQMEQVIMNLAVNARDAMPDGGTLTIETRNEYLDADYARDHLTITPGPFVIITVTDTGVGIEDEIKQRIFEPFFTTKEVGKGTGLGLSTVHGIIKQSGGEIIVYSELMVGTTFKIYLPCVDEQVQRPKWVDPGKRDYSGSETILFVEDEEIVRNLVREILINLGYEVLEANSGADALSICRSHRGPINLLLTDVIMPKMGGRELKGEIVKLFPDIRILYMSGYTDDTIVHSGILQSDTAFIEKPFSPSKLGRKIREVLDTEKA